MQGNKRKSVLITPSSYCVETNDCPTNLLTKKPRTTRSLFCQLESGLEEKNAEELTHDLCVLLNERKRELIARVVSFIGCSRAVQLYKDTQRLQKENGGLLRANGGRRSNGGVFMQLFKDSMPADDYKKFTKEVRAGEKAVKKEKNVELDRKLAGSFDALLHLLNENPADEDMEEDE